MTPYECLSEEDKMKIENFISYCQQPITQDLPYILRFWNTNKEKIFHAFGDKLILEKEIRYEKSKDIIEDEINSLIDCHTSMFRFLSNAILHEYTDMDYCDVRVLCGWWDTEAWYENKLSLARVNDNCQEVFVSKAGMYIKLGANKNLQFQDGMRQSKVTGKLIKCFAPDFMDEYEEFRLELSRILNEKTLTGTLCLSIHPLDYMTMSVNDEGWSSCMSWDPEDDGCYKQGTVEMMNSYSTVVAYLKSKHNELHFPGVTWNSKKWRTLLVATPYTLATIKGYPYQNEDLAMLSLDFFNSITGDNYATNNNHNKVTDNYKNFYFGFLTYAMYNDFSYSESNLCLFAKEHFIIEPDNILLKRENDDQDKERLRFRYSGPSECIICGKDITNDLDSEGNLGCRNCLGIIGYCCDCGEPIYENDIYSECDGEYYCEYCADSNLTWSENFDGYCNNYGDYPEIRILAKDEKTGTFYISEGELVPNDNYSRVDSDTKTFYDYQGNSSLGLRQDDSYHQECYYVIGYPDNDEGTYLISNRIGLSTEEIITSDSCEYENCVELYNKICNLSK